MANFIERTLEPGEKVIFKGRLHWSYNFSYTFWGIMLVICAVVSAIVAFQSDAANKQNAWLILGAVVAVVGLGLVFFGYFIRTKTEFAVTNTRFIQKDGIFNIKMTEIPLFKVETVNFYQSIFERMLGTGSIELVGSGGTNHKVSYVQHPYKVRNMIATLMKEKQKES